ncbi:hypothetical protein [Streptosporangium sp. NPDC006007]|uniref:nSTAND1 domain-containing NTPase n=1 Tax=Streptosporangium sp. NPDC006007 TaxID=3154575 RepID=UPI0033AEA554
MIDALRRAREFQRPDRLRGPAFKITSPHGCTPPRPLQRGSIVCGACDEEFSPSDWPVLVLEPTGSPLTRLAGALAALAGVPAPDVVRSLSGDPRQAPLLVRQAVETDARRRTLPAAAGGRLVLVVDQFEEIFTLIACVTSGSSRGVALQTVHGLATPSRRRPGRINLYGA